ncbi:MAG: hypothetical protein ACJ8J0_14085 [Longimicrobiaceae bacterium]
MSGHKLVNQDRGPISAAAAQRALDSGDPREISLALLRLALHGPDWKHAETLARGHATHPDVMVRRNAATALGHIARVHGRMDVDASLRLLHAMREDPEVTDWADAALDDFEMFLGVRHPSTEPPFAPRQRVA